VETHDTDPTAGEPADPWDTFRAEFDGLGNTIKQTYRRVAGGGGPSEDEILSALGTLMGAWDKVAESVGSALKDPVVRERLKTAAGSFATAMGTTLSELGREIREAEPIGSDQPDDDGVDR
jgi:hypothetical protein